MKLRDQAETVVPKFKITLDIGINRSKLELFTQRFDLFALLKIN